jgi:hypothetical protein
VTLRLAGATGLFLLGAFCAGCGGSDDNGYDGPDKLGGTGCVDIVVTGNELEGPEWLKSARPIPGGFWATAAGVHVAWIASRGYPEGSIPQFLEDTRAWLVISTFDHQTGQALEHRTIDVIPRDKKGWLTAFRGLQDGQFAVSSDWRMDSRTAIESVLLGRIDDPDFLIEVEVNPGVDSNQFDATAIGWDGEAFAWHGQTRPDLYVVRIAPNGEVLLPFTAYGVSGSVGWGPLGHRTATNSVSGWTYVFDAASDLWVAAHRQDGSVPEWAEQGGKYIQPAGLPDYGAGGPALAADELGAAWLLWRQSRLAEFFSVVARLSPEGDVELVRSYDLPADDPGNPGAQAILPRDPTSAWLFTTSGYRAYVYDFAEGVVGAPRKLIAWHTGDLGMDLRELTAFEWQGERWIGFNQTNQLSLRLLKDTGDCVYPPPER